jgi:hypothetical protein
MMISIYVGDVDSRKEDEEEESYYPLPRRQEDVHQSTTGRCSTGTPVETPRHRRPWWIQFLQFINELIWCVLWYVVGNPIQLLIGRASIILLLPSTIVAGTPSFARAVTMMMRMKSDKGRGSTAIPTKRTKAERTTKDSDDQRRGMVPEKETTIATSSPSSSSSARVSNELSFGSTNAKKNKDTTTGIDAKHCHTVVVLYDDDDDDDGSHSNIDAYLARELQKKQVAPIQSIDVTCMKTIDHCCTMDGGNNHHLDNDDLSVLTMDPTLQAISRRVAEGLCTYPYQPHLGLSAMMVVGPRNDNVDDDDDDDDDDAALAAADDLSDIAPLDLVSL